MRDRLSIRGGSGLGDSLYVQGVSRYLVQCGCILEVCTAWPDVFLPLGDAVKIAPFRRNQINRLAHYSQRRSQRETSQWQDCCIAAGLGQSIELRLDWTVTNRDLAGRVRGAAENRPIVAVQLPRLPMDRKDGFGKELLPDCGVIQRIIREIGTRAFFVQVGKGPALFQFEGIDLDLADRTSVAELIDVVSVSDACLGYCSFVVPLAESLNKPGLLVWSRRGLDSTNDLIKALTPRKVIHRSDLLKVVIDDCSADVLAGAVNAILEQVRMPVAV